ncbi:hypothetical protein [Nitratireductor sp. GCM10026969]|uniref:hypothetical protein n=1 Tax=Nitratireductor sp. GCM10026969 TaxID=3252645 RepID=UPI0036145F98
MPVIRLLFATGFMAALCAPAGAYSNATEYLITQEIAAACEGRPGEIDPAAVIEKDLTGDGETDLVLSHEGIGCAGPGPSRSIFCGAQLCTVNFYVRRGGLLHLEREMLGAGVSVEDGATPRIRMHGAGGRAGTVQWDGRSFQ